MKIGGNISTTIQILTSTKNDIGEGVPSWKDALSFIGWLDLSSGDSPTVNFNAKIQESTHVLVCDYLPLVYKVEGQEDVILTSENSRAVINGKVYNIMIIDNVMEMNCQLEIYLKFVGGQ